MLLSCLKSFKIGQTLNFVRIQPHVASSYHPSSLPSTPSLTGKPNNSNVELQNAFCYSLVTKQQNLNCICNSCRSAQRTIGREKW